MDSTPSITDWISAVSSLIGIPLVIWGIIQLFIKDKDKQRQLDSLETIANSQAGLLNKVTEQINELSKQTSEFQYQSVIMNESNRLIEKQIELQNEIFLHNRVSVEKKLELEKQKRIQEIKPHFIFNNAMSGPDGFIVRLLNKGNTARQLSIYQTDDLLANIAQPSQDSEVDTNKELAIKGSANPEKTFYNSNLVPFQFILNYEDIDGNTYSQEVQKRNNSYHVGNPIIKN